MKLSTISIALTSFVALVLGLPAPMAEELVVRAVAAPQNFSIKSFGMVGSGCPPESAWYLLSAERSAISVGFSKFYAEIGPNIPPSSNRKLCSITFGVRIPDGFAFAITSVETRGWYQLDSAVTAWQQALYYTSNTLVQLTARRDFVGPISGQEYVFNDAFNPEAIGISPCGTSTFLSIQAELGTSNSANKEGTGYIGNVSNSTSLEQTFYFNFIPCRRY